MNRYRPLSRTEINCSLSLGKINKNNIIRRNNMSSFARRINYNNPRLYMSNILQNKSKPKLFSLLDINDKITNSRGTVLPKQFKRLTDEENKRLFGFSYKADKRYDFSKIQQILERKGLKTPKKEIIRDERKDNEGNGHYYNRYNSEIRGKLKSKNNKFFDKNIKIKIVDKKSNELNKYENYKNNSNDSDKIMKKNQNKIVNSKSEKKQIEYKENQKNNEYEIKIRNSKDIYLPKGYASYELLVRQPKLFLKQFKKDNNINRNYSLTLKQIRDKANKSDIFFLKNPSEKEVSFKYEIVSHNYQNSDIFNVKNDKQNLLKSSEKYLFKNINGDRYNITRESNSRWEPRVNIPALINYSSKEYNILSPGKKGISSTKERIINESENRKDINSKMINNVNYMNPIYRQKGIAEFIDITKNGASNPGIDFTKTFYNNPKCFFKQNEACNTFYDSHLQYKNICERPFVKDFLLK